MVTALGILGFDPATKRMRIEATHPGITVQTIGENTGFELLEAPEVRVTDPPSVGELAMLRALDPDRRFLG